MKNKYPIQLEKEFFHNGLAAATYIYYKNGNLKASGLYVNEQKDSTWNYYNRDSVIILQEIYSSGKLNGTVKTFHDEGSIYEIKTYKKNILSGIWKQFFLNGQLKLEGSYVDGKRHGLQKYFFSNGIPICLKSINRISSLRFL